MFSSQVDYIDCTKSVDTSTQDGLFQRRRVCIINYIIGFRVIHLDTDSNEVVYMEFSIYLP
jgi:hypothetical protein